MGEMLFLLKTAQAKHFFQQNLAILAQPEASVIRTRYKQRWVQHSPDEPLPGRVLIVFSEARFAHFLPVREAHLSALEWDEGDASFVYELRLGPLWPLTPDREAAAFFAEHRPHENAMVFAAPALQRREGGSPVERWQALVHYLSSPAYAPAESNAYASALFAFAHPLRDPAGEPMNGEGALQVGQRYERTLSLLAPGLPREALAGIQPHLDFPREAATVTAEGDAAAGHLTLAIQPLQPTAEPWQVTLLLRPTAVPSSAMHLAMPPIIGTSSSMPQPEPEPFQRLPLFEWLARRLSPQDQLRLLDRFLLPTSPVPDAHLLLARATLLKQAGEAEEAFQTLLRIPPEEHHDESLVLLIECAVAVGRRVNFLALLDQINDWDNSAHVRHLVAAVARLPEESILPVARHLCVLAPVYAYLLWKEVGPTLRLPTNRLAFLRLLQGEAPEQSKNLLHLTPDDRYQFLARGTDPARLTSDYLEALIEAGLHSTSPASFAPFFMEWLTRELRSVDRSQLERARDRFESASHWLSTAQQEAGVLMLLEALKRNGLAESGIWLAIGRVDEALRASDFERAERWLREARTSISAMPPESRSEMSTLIRAEDESIKQARDTIAASFASRFGSDPGLAPILKLYGIEAVDAFWGDLVDVMQENEYVVRQLIERLEQLQQFGQQSGSANASIHSLSVLPGNVSRMELSDSARLVFRKVGRTIRLIALYANHDAYEHALRTRFDLLNRVQQGV